MIESAPAECACEVAAFILAAFGLDQEDALYGGFDETHRLLG
jgi:hypothetical protein